MAALPEWLAELPRLLGPGVGVVVVLRHGERERCGTKDTGQVHGKRGAGYS